MLILACQNSCPTIFNLFQVLFQLVFNPLVHAMDSHILSFNCVLMQGFSKLKVSITHNKNFMQMILISKTAIKINTLLIIYFEDKKKPSKCGGLLEN